MKEITRTFFSDNDATGWPRHGARCVRKGIRGAAGTVGIG